MYKHRLQYSLIIFLALTNKERKQTICIQYFNFQIKKREPEKSEIELDIKLDIIPDG